MSISDKITNISIAGKAQIVTALKKMDELDQSQITAVTTQTTNIHGDKISLSRTDVMREFPFPFQDLRGLVTESLVWRV